MIDDFDLIDWSETEQPDDPEATLAVAIIGLIAALTFIPFAGWLWGRL